MLECGVLIADTSTMPITAREGIVDLTSEGRTEQRTGGSFGIPSETAIEMSEIIG